MVDLENSKFVFDRRSENSRFGTFGRPAEPSATTGGRQHRAQIFKKAGVKFFYVLL